LTDRLGRGPMTSSHGRGACMGCRRRRRMPANRDTWPALSYNAGAGWDTHQLGLRCKMGDLLSASERDAMATPMLRQRLEPLGLTEIAPRRWIDGSKPPARRLFELQLLKGASLKACWGFSLDFVPHISGRSIRWHRSDKTARLDVIVDPVALPQPCFLYGPERLRVELDALLPDAVAAAQRDWGRDSTYEGMLDLIREIREKNTNCFGFRNYTQLPLAFAFLLAKTGNMVLAEQELEAYLAGDWIKDAEAAKLSRLLRESGGAGLTNG
jgi:hypothetical protein